MMIRGKRQVAGIFLGEAAEDRETACAVASHFVAPGLPRLMGAQDFGRHHLAAVKQKERRR